MSTLEKQTDLQEAGVDFEQEARKVLNNLGYITQDQLVALAAVLPSTTAAWRKRGEGPTYSLIGNRFVYPLAAIKTWLDGQVREPDTVERDRSVGSLL